MVSSVWESIASLARLAPTPHNTQPFRVLPGNDQSAKIFLVTDRLLPEEDRGNRYVASAFGIFTAALERSARHFGLELAVTPVADIDPATLATQGSRTLLGYAKITGKCVAEPQDELFHLRRTSRIPYHKHRVDAKSIAALEQTAKNGGHRLIVHHDQRTVNSLLELNAHAIIDNLQFDKERKEIQHWVRAGATPKYGDGLWQKPMNQADWEMWAAFTTPRILGSLFRQDAVRQYMDTQRGTRHFALLCGPFGQWPELISAGKTLLELWLQMARLNIYMQPMGSMLTNPAYGAEIARRFGVNDCWLIFRFGYSDVPPRSPRLKSIVIYE